MSVKKHFTLFIVNNFSLSTRGSTLLWGINRRRRRGGGGGGQGGTVPPPPKKNGSQKFGQNGERIRAKFGRKFGGNFVQKEEEQK